MRLLKLNKKILTETVRFFFGTHVGKSINSDK